MIVKDTKTHPQRVIALDPGTMDRRAAHREFAADRAGACGTGLAEGAPSCSQAVDGSKPLRPEHAKTSTTLDIYAAFLEPNDRHAAGALGELLNGEDGTRSPASRSRVCLQA